MRRLLRPDLPDSGAFDVDGDEGHHLVRVLRAAPGMRVAVFDGRGREVEAEVVATSRGAARLAIVAERAPRRPERTIDLIVAAPKGRRMEWLVEKCTEAGVARVLPFAARRGSRPEASDNTLRRWRRSAGEAAKQCGRADIPDVLAPRPLGDVLADVHVPVLVATPGSSMRLDAALPGGAVALVVGSEGGLAPDEDEVLEAAGAEPFGLGALILRIETAAVVAVHTAATAPASGRSD